MEPYYQDEWVTIYHGDCREILPTLEKVDLVLTSPPFNRERNDTYMYYNDTLPNYYEWLLAFCNEACRLTKTWAFINLQKNYYNKVSIYRLLGALADSIMEVVIWGKDNPTPSAGFSITNSWELFLALGNVPLVSNTTYTKNLLVTGVNSEMPIEHKAVMRSDIAEWFITHFSKAGTVILDPCLGLGTTAYCAKKLNRKCIGIEIKEKYCEIAAKRCSQSVMRLDI